MAESAKQKRKPKNADKKQSERFKETAREIGVDESGDDFERTFAKVVPPRSSSGQK